MKKILIIDGHPRSDSFSTAIADVYEKGSTESEHEVRRVAVRDLNFDVILTDRRMSLEPDLLRIQADIKWCEHLVLVMPIWWMGVPALMKGFFDRILTSGFAFKHNKGLHILPERLLKGKSARVIYTQDMPKIVADFAMRGAFWIGLKWGVLWYCGFWPVRRLRFSRVFASNEQVRNVWLKKVFELGKKAN